MFIKILEVIYLDTYIYSSRDKRGVLGQKFQIYISKFPKIFPKLSSYKNSL